MRRVTLSPRAQRDIDGIWNFTAERFGAGQAETYIRAIEGAVRTIAEEPRRGRACDDVRAGYFKFPVGSHVLFFRLIDANVDIVRILHASMDFGSHLP